MEVSSKLQVLIPALGLLGDCRDLNSLVFFPANVQGIGRGESDVALSRLKLFPVIVNPFNR